jgi:hypothetical protein
MDRNRSLVWSLMAGVVLAPGLLFGASCYTARLDDPAAVYLAKGEFAVQGDGGGEDFATGAMQWGTKMADVVRAFRLAPAAAGRPFYVTNELELKTWSFTAGPDGTLSAAKLFAQEGGEGVTTDQRGNVYIAAGRIRVFDPSGKPIDAIDVPQSPTGLVFGGTDNKTLFITARSCLYGVGTRFSGAMGIGQSGLSLP